MRLRNIERGVLGSNGLLWSMLLCLHAIQFREERRDMPLWWCKLQDAMMILMKAQKPREQLSRTTMK
jgi:hypothetical protein